MPTLPEALQGSLLWLLSVQWVLQLYASTLLRVKSHHLCQCVACQKTFQVPEDTTLTRTCQGTPDMGRVRVQARAPAPAVWCSRPDSSAVAEAARRAALAQREFAERAALLRTAIVRQQLFFPDRRLIQYDCGKLQVRMLLPTSWACLTVV